MSRQPAIPIPAPHQAGGVGGSPIYWVLQMSNAMKPPQDGQTPWGIPLAVVRESLAYEFETGTFRWRACPNKKLTGTVAGKLSDSGYLMVQLYGHRYYAHRLAWFYMHGEWPTFDIDHINRDPADNRIANLRQVTNAINCQNRTKSKNKLGLMGVSQHRRKFVASITVGGKRFRLGRYTSAEAAHAAYMAAKRDMHPGFVE